MKENETDDIFPAAVTKKTNRKHIALQPLNQSQRKVNFFRVANLKFLILKNIEPLKFSSKQSVTIYTLIFGSLLIFFTTTFTFNFRLISIWRFLFYEKILKDRIKAAGQKTMNSKLTTVTAQAKLIVFTEPKNIFKLASFQQRISQLKCDLLTSQRWIANFRDLLTFHQQSLHLCGPPLANWAKTWFLIKLIMFTNTYIADHRRRSVGDEYNEESWKTYILL